MLPKDGNFVPFGGTFTTDTSASSELNKVMQGTEVIRTIDLYRFLTKGDQSDNVSLTDNDVIRIPSYDGRITLEGEIKRPGIFEVISGENLQNVINYASGFTENAYKNRILVKQKTLGTIMGTPLSMLKCGQLVLRDIFLPLMD